MRGGRAAAIICVLLSFVPAPARAQHTASHVEVQEATLLARYRFTGTGAGVHTANQLEDKIAFRARLKADRKGKLSLDAGVLSGSSLTGSWNNTGLGMGSRTFDLAVRQLYVAAVPVAGIEGQVGSFYVLRGESTEITSYDNDAYLTGERVAIRRPGWLFVDALWVSRAYLGDITTPNVFERLDRLSSSNYLQVLAEKTLGPYAVSVDWTNAPEGASWRSGIRCPLIDERTSLRVEAYLRARDHRGGAAISADRAFGRAAATVGLASIDARFPPLNGDRYRTGARVFAGASLPLTGALAASVFYTQAVHEDDVVPVGHRFETLLTFDARAAVRQARHPGVRSRSFRRS